MRSPEYYKAKAKWIGWCVWWTAMSAAVVWGLVDFIMEWNRSGELEYLVLMGLLAGLFCGIKTLRCVYAERV